MATSIEWTDETWNPVVGCEQISPGCAHCYAKEQWDRRHKAHQAGKAMAAQYAQPFEVVRTMPERLLEPLKWRAPRRVFVNSVSDLFHEDVPDAFIDAVFTVMSLAHRHTFQVLTKRADRMLAYVRRLNASTRAAGYQDWPQLFDGPFTAITEQLGANRMQAICEVPDVSSAWPLPNVWLGVSVENQHFADERIPLLLQTPAAVRFISAEPLLGPVDIRPYIARGSQCDCGTARGTRDGCEPAKTMIRCNQGLARLAWVIVGGESGPGSRPFDIAWGRSIVQQCQAAGVPAFVKQIGTAPVDHGRGPYRRSRVTLAAGVGIECEHGFDVCPKCDAGTIPLRDKKGGNPDEWPADLRVRQFPEVRQ